MQLALSLEVLPADFDSLLARSGVLVRVMCLLDLSSWSYYILWLWLMVSSALDLLLLKTEWWSLENKC